MIEVQRFFPVNVECEVCLKRASYKVKIWRYNRISKSPLYNIKLCKICFGDINKQYLFSEKYGKER